ncbi:MAG: hypothetical protein ABW279_07050 [Acidimicrobiales bacterium]
MEPTVTDEPTRPWYRRPGLLAALALLVLGLGFGVGLLLAAGDDGDQVDTTDTTVTSVAPTAAPTTAPATTPPTTNTTEPEDLCAAGDQVACDQLDDDQLQDFCDDGNVDACQVLLARQGDGVPDGPNGEGNGNGNGKGNGNGNGNGDEGD